MPQTDNDKRGVLALNSTGAPWSSFYPDGDRPGGGGGGGGTLIARADWSLHDVTPSTIETGATWSVYGGVCSKVSDYFRIQYPNTMSGGMSAGVALQLNEAWDLPEIYTEFQARIPSTMVGPKFYKVHGDNSGTDYSNTTYQLTAGSGQMDAIGFGDGVLTGNDVANALFLDGANPTWIGRNYGLATVTLKTPPASFVWDSTWHTFRIRHKYNSGTTSGNEVNDGVYYVEIDGVVYVHAINMFNRHYLNTRRVNQLTFGDWVQNDLAAEIHFKNIKVSTGGFV